MIPWTVDRQALLSMEFSKQESWSGLPFSSPEDLLDPGIKPRSLALWVDSLPSEPPGKPNIANYHWFQVNSEGTQPYIYIYPFFPKLPFHPGSHILCKIVCHIMCKLLPLFHFVFGFAKYMSIEI